MKECLFCQMSQGQVHSEKIYQDDKIFVIRDIQPKAATHLLVIPHQHLSSLTEATSKDEPLLGYLLHYLPQLAKAQQLSHGFRTVINTGQGAGQQIFNLHLYLLSEQNLTGF